MTKFSDFDRKIEGFTLIELLIVVAIIGILASVSIPSYIGMQEKGRRGSVFKVINMNKSELQSWVNATKKGGTVLGGLTEVDTNGNGTLEPGTGDLTNNVLATSGIVTTFILATQNMAQLSPWNSALDLWISGGIQPTQAACDAVAALSPGQITLCYTPDENQSIRAVFISATNNNGSLIYQQAVTAD